MCKGDRICEDGRCVDPDPETPAPAAGADAATVPSSSPLSPDIVDEADTAEEVDEPRNVDPKTAVPNPTVSSSPPPSISPPSVSASDGSFDTQPPAESVTDEGVTEPDSEVPQGAGGSAAGVDQPAPPEPSEPMGPAPEGSEAMLDEPEPPAETDSDPVPTMTPPAPTMCTPMDQQVVCAARCGTVDGGCGVEYECDACQELFPLQPLNDDLWLSATGNAVGVQGAFYELDDGDTEELLLALEGEYVCLTGLMPAAVDEPGEDWGAAFGLILADFEPGQVGTWDGSPYTGLGLSLTAVPSPLDVTVKLLSPDVDPSHEHLVQANTGLELPWSDFEQPEWGRTIELDPSSLERIELHISRTDADFEFELCARIGILP